jgi:hypothetical protein
MRMISEEMERYISHPFIRPQLGFFQNLLGMPFERPPYLDTEYNHKGLLVFPVIDSRGDIKAWTGLGHAPTIIKNEKAEHTGTQPLTALLSRVEYYGDRSWNAHAKELIESVAPDVTLTTPTGFRHPWPFYLRAIPDWYDGNRSVTLTTTYTLLQAAFRRQIDAQENGDVIMQVTPSQGLKLMNAYYCLRPQSRRYGKAMRVVALVFGKRLEDRVYPETSEKGEAYELTYY